MKKTTIYLLTLMLLAGCEKNFDPNIYGTLNSSNFPATEKDYESYAMLCYTPFTTTWVYFIGSGYNQHSMYIPEGGAVRLFDATSDIMAPWTTGWGGRMATVLNGRFFKLPLLLQGAFRSRSSESFPEDS